MVDRRAVLAAASLWPIGARTVRAQGSAGQIHLIDLDRLADAFPQRLAPPALLRRLGAFMNGTPLRSFGDFTLAPQWSDGHFSGAAHVYDDFALVFALSDGSAAGYWLGGGTKPPPLVWLGAPGEAATLAPDLETLLARVAIGDFPDDGPGSSFLHKAVGEGAGAVPDLRNTLAGFLLDEANVMNPSRLTARALPDPDPLAAWVDATAAVQDAKVNADPAMQAIGALLARHRGAVPGRPTAHRTISVTWAGDRYDAWISEPVPAELAEAPALREPLGHLRDAAARTPGLGLWTSARLTVAQDQVALTADYLGQPLFRLGLPPAEAFRQDEARLPRAARRMPRWLAEIIDGAGP